jgi:hypothetical protein
MPFLTLPWWASWLVSLVARLVGDWAQRAKANAALKDMGAAVQRADSLAEAQRQEEVARRAADAAKDGQDDPRDLRD